MTIILTALGSDAGLFSLGDMLTSAPGYRGIGIPLPLQFDEAARSSGGNTLVGFAQKLCLVTPTVLVSWAGSHIVAVALTKEVQRAARDGRSIDLVSLVAASGLSPTEIEQVAFIVHEVVDGEVKIQCLNAEQGRIDGMDAAWSGSGSFDFLHDTIIATAEDAPRWQDMLRSLLTRTATTLAGEAMHGTPYEYMYGGWFEMVISRTAGLRKIPYALKFWGRRSGQYGYDAPVFFNWYDGRTLYVCSLDQRSGSSDVRVLEVPDVLSGKKWRKVRIKPRYRPEFTFHVVLDEETGGTEVHISDRHSPGHMSMTVSKDGRYKMSVRHEFIDSMMAGTTEPIFTVSKESDVATG